MKSDNFKKRLVSTLAITALVVFACEVTLRLSHFLPRYAVQLAGRESTVGTLSVELDPERLFRLLPDPHIGINAAGFRDPEILSLGTPPTCDRVAILGDSIVMGMAVDSAMTIAKQLSAISNHKVCGYNFGIQGYGPDQSLRVLEDDVIPKHPDLVVLVLYPENDFSDLIRNRMVQVSDSGELNWIDQNVVAQRIPWMRLAMLMRLAFTGRFLESKNESDLDQVLFRDRGELLSDPVAPAAISGRNLLHGVLREYKRQLNSARIPFLVVVVPGLRAIEAAMQSPTNNGVHSIELANEQLASLVSTELEVPIIDLSAQFLVPSFAELYDKNDLHLSEKGHQLVASNIAAHPIP